MILFDVLGAAFAFLVTLVSLFWLMAQINPPGGRWVRLVYLVIMVLIASFVAMTVFDGPYYDAHYQEDPY